MARRFSFRPAFTMKGRKFLGLRGYTGKPFHPPLTDIPVGAYILAAVGDLPSFFWNDASWSQAMFHAAGWALIGGAIVSLAAALTGFFDWWKSTQKGTQARRTANAHAWTMLTVTALVLIDIVVRLGAWDDPATSGPILVLTLVVAGLTFLGAGIGGSLVYDYGFNVMTAGDHPVYHPSEEDVFPGRKTKPES